MTLRAKRRIVFSALLVLAVWPLAHRALVARYEISPWRLFGWAMYCQPKLSLEVGTVAERGGVPFDVEIPDSVIRARARFGEMRVALGRLVSPADLARLMLTELPEADRAVVVIQRNRLDPASARIVGRREYFRFERAADGVRGERFSVRELP